MPSDQASLINQKLDHLIASFKQQSEEATKENALLKSEMAVLKGEISKLKGAMDQGSSSAGTPKARKKIPAELSVS